ncbi:MAG TPA: SusC/RagA family TonB-linked outer membrane protein, partial [Parapedobacter sp.]|nr:SusC/RagA family TonB-linked outer membrane protein [Parapedobacter sp.]
WDTTRYTDWQKELAGNPAAYTDVQVQYAGGNANTQFLLSTSYHHDESTLLQPNQGNRRMTGMLNVSHQFGKEKGNINAGINYTLARNRIPYSSINAYSSAISLPPNAPPLYDENGKLNWADGTWTNPLAQAYRLYDYLSGNFNGHATATYYILPQFYLKANAGLTILNTNDHYAYPKESLSPSSTGKANASFGSGTTKNWIVEPQIGYDASLGGSKVEILFGASWQQNTFQNLLTHGYDYTSDELLGDLSSAGRTESYSNASTYAYTAIFGRINYNWMDKHVLNATVRRDGSSRFGPGRRFANFGSLGYAYIFTEEAWLKDHLPVLSFGKLRISYGTTGNDQIGDYQYLDTYSSNYLAGYEDVPPLVPTELFNPDYQWESTRKFDVGLDLGFLNDRIHVSGAYFLTRSSNQLLSEKLPSQTGFTNVYTNREAVLHNSGIELMANTTNIDNGHFRWTSSINMTFPRDKLVAYPGLAQSSYAQTYIVGESYTQTWYGYKYLGVNPANGLYDFVDVNGDGKITSIYDRLQYDRWPRAYYGGLSNRLAFKGLSLEFMLYYHHRTVSGAYLHKRPGSMANQLRRVYEDAWRSPGDITDIPRFSADGSEGSQKHTLMYSASGAVKDASYLRLRNVSLAYELPRTWIKGTGLKSVSVHMDAQNLITWSGYDKTDPESQNPNYLPPLRTYVFGAAISF